jgi:hypothetical protein
MAEIGPDARFRNLLAKGFFPHELPPPFVSDSLARKRQDVAAFLPSNLQPYSAQYESYSLPRFNANRRRLAVVNPIPYFALSRVIALNWPQIKSHLKKSKLSFFKPVFDLSGERTFLGIDFDAVRATQHDILGRYDSCFRTDVSNFYPRIYTHSIPWALIGKEKSKAQMHSATFKKHYANQLDIFVRNMQDKQTIGVPIGPETSRLLAEIVSVAIDTKLQKQLKLTSQNALRFVDDHIIAIRRDLDEGKIHYALSRELAEFELELNFAKTKQIGVGGDSEPAWLSELASLRFYRSRQIQTLDRYFERAFSLADQYPDSNVLRYALKKTASFQVSDESWSHYQLLLQQAVRRSGGSLISDFCSLVVNANFRGRHVDKEEAKFFIHDLIMRSAPLRHTHEVAWSLFLAKALKVEISQNACKRVIEMESSVCLLILIDLFNRGLAEQKLSASLWQKYLGMNGLHSQLWLLVYELHRKGWLGLASKGSFVEADPHFGPLIKAGVSFYSVRRNVPKIDKEQKMLREQKRRIRFVFTHIDRYF